MAATDGTVASAGSGRMPFEVIAATFERLQAQAMTETLGAPFVLATLARGVPRRRILWRDALRVALRPIASVYGLVAGTLLSGSFAVEITTAWPGLGRLMLDALRARDVYLVAGCAAAPRGRAPPAATTVSSASAASSAPVRILDRSLCIMGLLAGTAGVR